jgi:hypothetical protein
MMQSKEQRIDGMEDDAGSEHKPQLPASSPVSAPAAIVGSAKMEDDAGQDFARSPANASAAASAVSASEPAASGTSTGATAAAAAGAGAGAAGYPLKRSPTQIQITNNLSTKSTSVFIDVSGLSAPITPEQRLWVGNTPAPNVWKWTDGLKIAVFSQEASRHFSIRYWVSGAGRYQAHSGSEKCSMDQAAQDTLISKIGYYTNVSTYDDALTKLFENRGVPHVVAVIEGRRDNLPEEFSLAGSQYPASADAATTVATYKLHDSRVNGQNRLQHADIKQNMHFYVRNDMVEAITPKEVTIVKNFKVGEVHFETGSGKYSVIVPHIPNDIAKNADNADKLLRAYAQHVASDRTVVGYIGDTNYKKMLQEHSSPSAGGQQAGVFMVPASSGAGTFSYFMQAATFGPDKGNTFRIQQPALLNHVELRLDGNDKTATDHPSIQTTIFLDSSIKNRIYSDISVHPSTVRNLQCQLKYSSAVVAAVVAESNTVKYAQQQFQQPGTAAASAAFQQFQNAVVAAAVATNSPPQAHSQQPAAAAASAKPFQPPQGHSQQPAAAAASAKPFQPPQGHFQQPAAAAASAKPFQPPQGHSQQPAAAAASTKPFQPSQGHSQKPAAAAAYTNPTQNTNDIVRQFKAELQAQRSSQQIVKNKENNHDDEHGNSNGLVPML